MPLINQRWPRELCPETCRFGRSRNDVLQLNPYTRKTRVIRRGRPLWAAECSWTLPNGERLAQLRYWLDSLEGYAGSVQVWDFTSPYPQGLRLATSDGEGARIFWTYNTTRAPWTYAGLPSHWVLGSTVTTSAAVAAGAVTVPLAGLGLNAIAALQGQYVQIGRRLYVVASTTTSNGTGAATLTLTSGLLSAAASGEVVRLVEAACEMRLEAQQFSGQATAGNGFVTYSASFVETVEDYA